MATRKNGPVRIVQAASLREIEGIEPDAIEADATAAEIEEMGELNGPELAELNAMLAALDVWRPEPVPTAPAAGRVARMGSRAVWQPDPRAAAACDAVGWTLKGRRASYAPRKLETLSLPIPTAVHPSEKKGKVHKHLILQLVQGMGGVIPSLYNGERLHVSILANYIGKFPEFQAAKWTQNVESTMNKIADYCGRYCNRDGNYIFLSDSRG